MKHVDFVHLHLHTQYSLLDGAIRLGELFQRAKSFSMSALAITDHGNMFGAVDFYKKAEAHGIKPILGCEVYVAPGSCSDKSSRTGSDSPYHLILLARTPSGYRNLIKLVSRSYRQGFYRRPRVDKSLLREHRDGLIALSACLQGEIPQLINQERFEEAIRAAQEYASIFSDGCFYLELQENGIPEQTTANQGLLQIGKQLGLPVVATNDCHYLDKKDVKAHEVLVAVNTGKTLSDSDRMRFSTEDLYFRSPEEMKTLFQDCPEAIRNTIEIAERCNVEMKFGAYRFPVFPLPETETPANCIRSKAIEGLQKRLSHHELRDTPDFASVEKVYCQRLEEELNVINSEGFSSYFLIVADFIQFAKDNRIPVGPGRGSAAGSLVAFALKITEIDPIKYGLLFERFLNPERISPPDIDVDFCMERRDEVIRYVRNKYGENNVAQIITFGKMQAKAVIRDVGRVLNMPYKDVDKIAKLVPNTLNITLTAALDQEPALKKLREEDSQVDQLISFSLVLEGLPRHASTHAAGVVIADRPLDEYLPLYQDPKNGTLATQFSMNEVADIGLIKFDFLGLKTLTVIDKALALIKQGNEPVEDINAIPLDDPATYDLLASGETEGVFQLEGSGMKELIIKMKPESMDDIVALLALYRPGPLQSGMVNDFIRRRKKEESIPYLVPQLKDILEDTYGVILYQEQVMKIAQVLAGYSLGEADLLRRAMGKKKFEEMEKQKEKFLLGTKKNKIDPKKAEEIFNLMANFAGYGFNKSHSVAYAVIAYQTAYLKAHYPVEFMAALLTCEMDNSDKVIRHISECRDRGIEVLPPHVNESSRDFTVSGNKIRFGLAAVKNVGSAALESILKSREEGGRFLDIFDFCERIDLRKANKKVVESLIKCGAFDTTGARRSQLFAVYELAIERGQERQQEKNGRQKSLFGIIESADSRERSTPGYPACEEWPEHEVLAYEKETLGFFISSHPLASYQKDLKRLRCTGTGEMQNRRDGEDVSLAGVPVSINEILTRKGERMAFVTIEDLHGSIEVVVFSELFRNSSPLLKSEQPLLIRGKVTMDERTQKAKLRADEILPLSQASTILTKAVHVRLDLSQLTRLQLERLRSILRNHPGTCAAYLHLLIPERSETIISLPEEFYLEPSEGLVREVESLFGSTAISLL